MLMLLGCCPAGKSYLMGKSASLAWAGHLPSVTIKIRYRVDVLLHLPVSHSIFSYRVREN